MTCRSVSELADIRLMNMSMLHANCFTSVSQANSIIKKQLFDLIFRSLYIDYISPELVLFSSMCHMN